MSFEDLLNFGAIKTPFYGSKNNNYVYRLAFRWKFAFSRKIIPTVIILLFCKGLEGTIMSARYKCNFISLPW